jgi:cysteine desulfurase
VSSGSACTSASLEPSYVLRALGVEEDMAHTSIRFGLGRFTTAAEVDRAVDLTVAHVRKLRCAGAAGGQAGGRVKSTARVAQQLPQLPAVALSHGGAARREMSPLWEMVQEGIDLKSIQWSQH